MMSPGVRKLRHQRSVSIREIQGDLPPHVDGRVEDAVSEVLANEKMREGWEPFFDEEGVQGTVAVVVIVVVVVVVVVVAAVVVVVLLGVQQQLV